jgi:DNA polymerase IV
MHRSRIVVGRGKPPGFVILPGFVIIDAEEAASPLAPEPVRLLPGVGAGPEAGNPGNCQVWSVPGAAERDATRSLGEDGPALVRRAGGEDARIVNPARVAKSVSAETTFDHDLSFIVDLERPL